VVRILTLVTLLALAAGLTLGFLVGEVRASGSSTAEVPPARRQIDQMVALYESRYRLEPNEAAEVRASLEEYDRKLQDLLRRLRVQNKDDFQALSDRANARIRAVIEKGR
jgi:hypothetical protein